MNIVIIALCIMLVPLHLQSQTRTYNMPYPVEPPASVQILYESREYPELLDEKSPPGLRVVQITTNPDEMSHHVYTEAQVITPDSRKFVFIRNRNYWICDIPDNFGIRQITNEVGAKCPSVSPDGKWMYYIVDQTIPAEGGIVTLKRVNLEDYTRETMMVLDGPIPGTTYKPSRFYNLSSISSDGQRLCVSAFLGDGSKEDAEHGVLVFDLVNPSVRLVFKGVRYSNMHPQYSRSLDPELSHDIMIQHDHGNKVGYKGEVTRPTGFDIDVHAISDNALKFRDFPVSRDGIRMIQGHQQWRGRTGSAIIAIHHLGEQAKGKKPVLAGYEAIPEPKWPLHPKPIYLASPVPVDERTAHTGVNIPGSGYIDITRNLKMETGFRHFSSDISGMHLVTDNYCRDEKTGNVIHELYVGTLSEGDNPELKVQYLLHTRSVLSGQPSHAHPFFSPDNRMVFFNSDLGVLPQVFMVTGYEFPAF